LLYPGLMVTPQGLKVLEFNCRFGDPETQAFMPRLKSDLVEAMEAVIDGRLAECKLEWTTDAAVCVVMASGGYPGDYAKGLEIHGIAAAEATGATVFHGRVLGVTALGADVRAARENAYTAAGKIHFQDAHYRRDIAARALKA
jgi:phosphoribosylamine--glycine ligase